MSAGSTASSTEIANGDIRHLQEVPKGMLKERTRILTPDHVKPRNASGGSVVYWMQRDVRTVDNWALILSSWLAQQHGLPLRVVYALPPSSAATSSQTRTTTTPPALIDLPMSRRHSDFLLGGLQLVYEELKQHNIPLHIVQAPSHDTVGASVCNTLTSSSSTSDCQASIVVADFSPLRPYRQWMELQALPILASNNIPFYQVDAHNIVPVWTASPKREVGARTLRSKINKVAARYLTDLPDLEPQKLVNASAQNKSKNSGRSDPLVLPSFDREAYEEYLKIDESVPSVPWAVPGTKAGMKQYDYFVKHSLAKYDKLRNDPTQAEICSNLSPWINHGHISFQTIARRTQKLNKYAAGVSSFLEEGIIRRELSDNYIYYSPNNYDSLSAAAGWAQETLETHASDVREHVYHWKDQLEQAQTHDDLWNAAQLQLVREGQMHGFLRMYWAKKILEWTESPAVALETAQYLNDKYALDGKDPNGFVGIAWSIMGVHDQGWKERPVFGKIRYMNYKGCQRKFKVDRFVERYPPDETATKKQLVIQNSIVASSSKHKATPLKKKSGQKKQKTE